MACKHDGKDGLAFFKVKLVLGVEAVLPFATGEEDGVAVVVATDELIVSSVVFGSVNVCDVSCFVNDLM